MDHEYQIMVRRPDRPIVSCAGALLGASVTNAELSAFLLGVGVGAIAQVITQIVAALRGPGGRLFDPATVGGAATGLVVMYLTGLLVTV